MRRPSSRAAAAAWAACGATATLAAARLGLAVADPESSSSAGDPLVPGGGVPMAAFEALVLLLLGLIGAVVTARQPRNPIGWILCAIPLSLGLLILGSHVYWSLALEHPAGSRAAEAVAWMTSWIWIAAMVPAVTLFPLLFPSGRPITRGWRWIVWVAIAACPALFVGTAFAPGRLEEYPIQNPLGASGAIEIAVGAIGALGFALMLGAMIAATVSLVIRFRRSQGIERRQLKWVAAAAALFLVIFVFPTDQLWGDDAGFASLLLGLLVVAGAMAISMLRYRLYDIDVVIRRTLVYGAVTAILAATYLVLAVLTGLTVGDSDLAIAGSTLAVAALFGPARARIQRDVDRRFYRRRYDAAQTLEAFSGRVRDELDLEALADDLRSVVRDTVAPAHLSLWLRRPAAARNDSWTHVA
jgi:hypothetical protein